MEAIVLETSNWFYVRIQFKDGTEHQVQVYDITTLNANKVHPYNFSEIIYPEKNEVDILKQKIQELEKEIEELKKQSNNSQVEEPIKDDEVKEIKISEKNNCLKDKKEIALLELYSDTLAIHWTNYDIDMGLDYKEGKKIIDKSKQDSIPFNVGKGTNERAYRLINTDVRTIKDDCIVLIPLS
jgi:TolA-binding protein